MPSKNQPSRYSIRAVDRVCDILDLIRINQDGLTLSDLADNIDAPKSTIFRYLSVLEDRNYISKDADDRTYRVGLAFESDDKYTENKIRLSAEHFLAELRDDSNYTTNLGFLKNGRVEHALVLESRRNMRLAATVGSREFIHSTALGKAIASGLAPEKVHSILDSAGMKRFTAATITTPEDYMVHLKQVSEQGYALDDSENQEGGRCVAVPIPGLPIPAGISVSSPLVQLPYEKVPEIVKALQEVGKKILTDFQAN